MFQTSLTKQLGIKYPIIQSGMSRVAGPDLVAAVSNAGGLGILAGLLKAPESLRKDIQHTRELTDKPFGVNLWLHPALLSPRDPNTLDPNELAKVQEALNAYRRSMGAEPITSPPEALPALCDAAFDVLVEERVAVFSVALGNPGRERVTRCHQNGVKVMAMICTPQDAKEVYHAGVDFIVAQGSEAGGHRSSFAKPAQGDLEAIGTIALIPQVVKVVDVPVIAAGGIAGGEGLVAALALGATGVLMGTRFVATKESTAPKMYKYSILEREPDATTITDIYTGLYGRAMRSEFLEAYKASRAPILPDMLQQQAAMDVFIQAMKKIDKRYFPMFAGQSNGLIENVIGAGEVVKRVVQEAQAVLRRLG